MGSAPNPPADVLVVDDSEFDRRQLSDVLRNAGMVVETAIDPMAAELVLATRPPAVLLTDLVMPKGGGARVCRAAASLGSNRPHVVVVSSAEATGSLIQALDLGADDYVCKPVDRAELVARVRVGLRAHAARLEAERSAQAVRNREAETRGVLNAMTEGLILFGTDGTVTGVNPALEKILGWTQDELVGTSPPFEWWPPEEHERISAAFAYAQASGRGDLALVFMRPDGRRFPVELTISPIRDGAGGHVATVRDVTDREALERRLRASETQQRALRRVAEAMAREAHPDLIMELIATGVAEVLGVECGLVTRFEQRTAVIVGTHGDSDTHSVGTQFSLDGDGALAQMMRVRRPVHVDYRNLPPDSPMRRIATGDGFMCSVAAPVHQGGQVWGAVLASTREPVRLPAGAEKHLGEFAELLGVAIGNAQARADLVSRATTDPLTGLANRRMFTERLSSELTRTALTGTPLSLVVIDIDHFKQINDRFGHAIGDEALRRVALLLKQNVRNFDLVARYGGEEFVVVFTDADQVAAMAVCEKLRAVIAAFDWGSIAAGLAVTMSFGVASDHGQGSHEQLLNAADAALYHAKSTGRNRVCGADGA